jgi:biopolymer transport protein TolR
MIRKTKIFDQPRSDINLTSLIDVCLTLVIIFIIAAPVIQQGIDVKLPQSKSHSTLLDETNMITVNKESKIFLNELPIPKEKLEEVVTRLYEGKYNKEIYIKADENVKYGDIIKVMDILKTVGIDKIGMVTDVVSEQ